MDITKTAREADNDVPSTPPYNEFCFLTIQNDIEREFIKIKSPEKTEVPETKLQRFPYREVSEDPFAIITGAIFPFLLVCCLFMSTKNIIKVSHLASYSLKFDIYILLRKQISERDD